MLRASSVSFSPSSAGLEVELKRPLFYSSVHVNCGFAVLGPLFQNKTNSREAFFEQILRVNEETLFSQVAIDSSGLFWDFFLF